MSSELVSTTVDILGKPYSIRCQETELPHLQQAAKYLSDKMLEVRESGKAINLERIAIITALNITYQLLQNNQQSDGIINKINRHLSLLQEKIDHAMHKNAQTELVYTTD